MRILAIIALLILASNAAAAPGQPTVSSGTIANGNSITITGTGFGVNGPTVVLYDSFDQGATGANIATTSNSATVGNWSELGETIQTYSTDYAVSGSKAMKIDWSTASAGGPQLNYPNVQNSDLLISWWQYMPSNKNVPGTNHEDGPNWKWFWIGDSGDGWPWGSDYVTTLLSNTDFTAIIGIFAADDTDTPVRDGGSWYDSIFRKGTWMRYTVALKNATSGGYIWNQEVSSAGNAVQFNLTNIVTAHSTDPWNVLTLPGFGRVDTTAAAYYDDVYVATGAGARARVEIGNASTYAACTNLTLLTPTSWSDTTIQATVRQGSFAAGSAYLYVVDWTGAVSPSRAITIGSGGGDTTAPSTTISTTDPSAISSDSLTVTGSASDVVGVSGCKWRRSSAPDGSNGTSCTGTTSFSCTTSGYSSGSNILYVGCYDAAGNYGSDSIVVNYTPSGSIVSLGTVIIGR